MNTKVKLKTIDGFKIAGVHTYNRSNRVVLWLHGITVDKDEYLGFFKEGADTLATMGIDSLRIDFRGHGDSSGTSVDFSVVGQMFDTHAAIKFIMEKYRRNDIALHIVGASFGAPPAIFSALRFPALIKSTLLFAPVLSYARTFLAPETEWARSIFTPKSLERAEATKRLPMSDKFNISLRLIEEMRLIRPDLALAEVQQRTTIIHGDSDSMVPYDVSKELSKSNSKIQFVGMTGMDHGFMDANDEEGTQPQSVQNKKRLIDLIGAQCQ